MAAYVACFAPKKAKFFIQGKVESSNSITVFFIIFIIYFIFLDAMYAHIHKPRERVFQIDKVLKSHKHTAFRLPPYHKN